MEGRAGLGEAQTNSRGRGRQTLQRGGSAGRLLTWTLLTWTLLTWKQTPVPRTLRVRTPR